ncbi:MAG: penicillin-binding protein, partial [Fischerella sp.]|nr:penicillin-binding protein [Fischerella sp.]
DVYKRQDQQQQQEQTPRRRRRYYQRRYSNSESAARSESTPANTPRRYRRVESDYLPAMPRRRYMPSSGNSSGSQPSWRERLKPSSSQ